MTRTLGVCAVAVVVGLLAAAPAGARPQAQPLPAAATQVAAASHGVIHGVVVDERGTPLSGAVVSALGSASAFAVSDRAGRFTLRSLPAGPYLLRVHRDGFAPARARMIDVRPAARDTMTIELHRGAGTSDAAAPQVLAAGVGASGGVVSEPVATSGDGAEGDDHSEIAWRLRHAKRSVLRDATAAANAEADADSGLADRLATLGRAVGSPARMATSLFAANPLSGQFNLLTTTSFEQPQDLFSGPAPRGVAYISLGAAAGDSGDWSMRAAFTQGDLTSWIVAGTFVSRPVAAHQYSLGLSQGMQRYQGGNPAALLAVADGARNVGSVSAHDSWTLRRGVVLGYGAAYARYDYLPGRDLFSPRVDLSLSPAEGLRVRAVASRQMVAPGAEEFLPPQDGSVWLPPQRTFAPLMRGGFRPEQTTHYEVALEQDLNATTVLGLRGFRQQVADQIVTVFGSQVPDVPSATIGHYSVASGGNVSASGWSVSLSRAITSRLHGSVDYTFAEAHWLRGGDRLLAVVAPSALRANAERLHDLTTTIDATMPYTATRVYLLYRVNNAFAAEVTDGRPRTDRRFEFQVNQSLPFLNFTSAQWEMLLAIRNVFRDELAYGSLYDELLVIRPPKRVVGGLTVRF